MTGVGPSRDKMIDALYRRSADRGDVWFAEPDGALRKLSADTPWMANVLKPYGVTRLRELTLEQLTAAYHEWIVSKPA